MLVADLLAKDAEKTKRFLCANDGSNIQTLIQVVKHSNSQAFKPSSIQFLNGEVANSILKRWIKEAEISLEN